MTGRSSSPSESAPDRPRDKERIADDVASPFVWLVDEDVDPLDARPAYPAWRSSKTSRQVIEVSADSYAEVATKRRGVVMNPGFLERVPHGDQDHARPGAIDFLDDASVL